jgi:hypothetical protein
MGTYLAFSFLCAGSMTRHLTSSECAYLKSVVERTSVGGVVKLDAARFEQASQMAFPNLVYATLDSHLIRLSENDAWDAITCQAVGNRIKAGYGPFFDELFRDTACWPCYVVVRIALLHKLESDKAVADYAWKVYKMPQILTGVVMCGLGVLVLLGIHSIVVRVMGKL